MESIPVPSFDFLRGPRIVFGAGRLGELTDQVAARGRRVLVVTGAGSHRSWWNALHLAMAGRGLRLSHVTVGAEPTAELVDEICTKYRPEGIDVVVAIGGGSALDTGKAVAAMLPLPDSVSNYLPGGEREHPGVKVSFIAVPTTSGTGSEATNNAVLTVDEGREKVSLRHPNFVPDVALIDPELMVACPRDVTAAAGLDTLTQLLESYVSPRANALSDSLTFSGLLHFNETFRAACGDGADDVGVRAGMAYASLLSGIALANVGLGIVHGLAAVLGARFGIGHGVCCGTLLGAATGVNIHVLRHRQAGGGIALAKYAMAGHLLSDDEPVDIDAGCAALVAALNALIDEVGLPRLGTFGVTEADLESIAAAGPRNNPAELTTTDVVNILKLRL